MTLKSVYSIFLKHPESAWIMVPENAQELYKLVRNSNITKVLDLGTGIGCSAAVVALALEDKGTPYHIDGIEQYEKCVKLANEIIPEELKKNLTIHRTNATVWSTEKIPYQYFSIYESLPEVDGKLDYDLIVNDGPAPFKNAEGQYIDLPNGTIHKATLEGKIKPGTLIVYDGRIVSLTLLEQYFSENFYLAKPALKGGDFNVIERKDNELKVGDIKLEGMELSSYFKD